RLPRATRASPTGARIRVGAEHSEEGARGMRLGRRGATWLLAVGVVAVSCPDAARSQPTSGATAAAAPSAVKPTWLAEDTWSYKGRTPSSTYTYQQTVAGEGVFEGRPAYDVRTGYYRSWIT